MAERLGHLDLPLFPQTYQKRKGTPPRRAIGRSEEDRGDYFEVQVQHLADITTAHQQNRDRYQEFLDPNLIFKLQVLQRVREDTLRQELERMDIAVLAPSPDNTGLWVVFAEDKQVARFQEKLEQYAEGGSYKFFDDLGDLVDIPIEEKIGKRLRERMLASDEIAYLDVEIWRMEDERLFAFLDGLGKLIMSRGGRITDTLVKQSFCLLRAHLNAATLDDILPLREVALIDRPPKPYLTHDVLRVRLDEVSVGTRPHDDAAAIAVLDSGVRSGHPLLQNAVTDEIAVGTWRSSKIQPGVPTDDVGHGTQVAGIALYGDLRACIEARKFNPEVWILSAKVMYLEENPVTGKPEARYDEEELLEHQLEEAISRLLDAYPRCRVVNISFGDEHRPMFDGSRQFNLAALVDEMSRDRRIIFVVSAGNLADFYSRGFPDNYPAYLLEETERVKIIDPASAALALTVGSITQDYGPSDRYPSDLLFSPANTKFPSPFTRVGLGYQGMIKPDLVDEGGNIILDESAPLPDLGGKLVTLNPEWVADGRLFSVAHGTSFAAPRIAHYAAKLFNRYPDYSHNLVKALLISSARIPADRPSGVLTEISSSSPDSEFAELLKVYGYGQPDVERAAFSSRQNVLLRSEKSIGLDSVHLYYFYLPDEFLAAYGRRTLTVTLVYDPPVNKNRVDYLGCSMEFHLFKNMDVLEVVNAYGAIGKDNADEECVPDELKVSEILLRPGVNLRKKGVHQKGMIEYKRQPRIRASKPLVLAVICRKKWIAQGEYAQDYAVVVSVEHTANIDLFNLVRAKNQMRARVSLR